MSYITISTEAKETFSLVSNHFIDYYMTEANGEFVKVYLYLIRLLSSKAPISVADIADHFNLTEKDICRAIRYWISEDVLRLDYDASGQLTVSPFGTNAHRSPGGTGKPLDSGHTF